MAANAYKTVAERGPWVTQLAEAHAVYARGDVDGARRAYKRLRDAGVKAAASGLVNCSRQTAPRGRGLRSSPLGITGRSERESESY